jgi:uncharacterized Zn finger protein (UPF0148 family)
MIKFGHTPIQTGHCPQCGLALFDDNSCPKCKYKKAPRERQKKYSGKSKTPYGGYEDK